jgi:hypothetical protein
MKQNIQRLDRKGVKTKIKMFESRKMIVRTLNADERRRRKKYTKEASTVHKQIIETFKSIKGGEASYTRIYVSNQIALKG